MSNGHSPPANVAGPRRPPRTPSVAGYSPPGTHVSTWGSLGTRILRGATTWGSGAVPWPTARQRDVEALGEEGLVGRLAATEGEEADGAGSEVELGPHEPMEPGPLDREGVAEDPHRPRIIGPAQVDDPAGAGHGRRSLPVGGPGCSRLGGLDADRVVGPAGRHVAPRAEAQGREVLDPAAGPDLGLPAPVETLDGGLEARLPRRGEDRRDAQAETEPDDRSEDVRRSVAAVEADVVVELGVGRSAEGGPVLDEAAAREDAAEGRLRPGADQPAMEADPGEDLEGRATLEAQALDGVEAVELDPSGGEIGQVPARRRRGAAAALPAIEGPAAEEDAADRPDGGHPARGIMGDERGGDGDRAVLTEDARRAQRLAQGEDPLLGRGGRAGHPPWGPRPIAEVDRRELVARGPREPAPLAAHVVEQRSEEHTSELQSP